MRASTWHGRHDVRVDTVPDPEIVNPRDAILRVTSTAICGSDLHLYDGYIPTLRAGDVLGHEFMGEVVEVGPKSNLEKGQRVVVPFTISCGDCFFCKKQQYSACDNSNPAETFDASRLLMGHPMGAAFGYAHLTGGYAGGQAEYVRVPYSDVGPIVIPDHLDDDQVLFLSDILPTGWMGAENAEIEDGDTVAVWGCGPVGLFAIQSACIMGAHRVIAIDHYPHRLELAKQMRRRDPRLSGGRRSRGARRDDRRHRSRRLHRLRRAWRATALTVDNIVDTVKAHTFLGTERPHALRQMILACRKGGRISIPGVYGGFADKFPLGADDGEGADVKSGQTHVQKYTQAAARPDRARARSIRPS